MRTIVQFAVIFSIAAFIFSATVNAAYALADSLLPTPAENISVQQLINK